MTLTPSPPGWLDDPSGGSEQRYSTARATSFHEQLRVFPVGRFGGYLAAAGAVLYVVSWLIEFAIFGTLTLALGLVCVALAFWVRRLGSVVDRALMTLFRLSAA